MTIFILLLHDSKLDNKQYLNKLKKRYPILSKLDDITIVVHRPRKTLPQKVQRRFDRVYYDQTSLEFSRVAPYITAAGNPQVVAIDLKRKRRVKNRTYVTRRIRQQS